MELCKVEICELERKHVSKVRKLIREIFPSWHAYYAEKAINNHKILVAKIEDEIVGFIQFKIVNLGINVGHIYYMGVKPEYRRRGIGRALVIRAEEHMKSKVECFIASTQEDNIPVLRLFKSLGYVCTTWRDAYKILRDLGADLEDEYDLMWRIYDYDDVVLLKLNRRLKI
ncbi:MAG: GNAT family N-acetyltransferase [Crenarchaeota archaeon]|nr:GNAT family N-acetyltransferase [Thermoproteota archaeon]